MNLYFSCSLTGGRKDEPIYVIIVDHLLGLGHTVPTAHLARPDVMHLEKIVKPSEVYKRDIQWIRASDAVVAEVSTPSHGVGYEVAYGLSLGKPVLCLYHREASVSKMLTGNDSAGLVVRDYRNPKEALQELDHFLEGLRS